MSDRSRKLAWAAVAVSAATGLSRVAGLLREILVANYYGATPASAAFAAISAIPATINQLLADAAISAAFVPVFARLLLEDRRDEAFRLAYKLLTLVIVVIGAVVAVCIIGAPLILRVFYPEIAGDASVADLSVAMMRALMPTVLLLTSAGVVVGVLYSFERFTAPAFGAVVWNSVTIVVLLLAADSWGIWALVIGLIAGTVGQFLLIVSALRGLRFRYRPDFHFRDPRLGRVLALMAPVTVTLGILNFNALVNMHFAVKVSDGSSAHLWYAFRLFQLPQGMFAIAIGTVLFPSLARFAAGGDTERFVATLSAGVRQIFFVSLPFVCWFAFMPEAIVRLIYEHGKFGPADTSAVSQALVFYALGMLVANGSIMFNRAFQSLQKPWYPFFIALGNLVLNFILAGLLWRPLGVAGITLSTAVVSAFNFFGLLVLMRGRLGRIDGRTIVLHLGRMVACAAALSAVSVGLWRALESLADGGLAGLVAVVVGSLTLGGLTYLGAARLLHVEELAVVSSLLHRGRRGTSDAGAAA